MAFLYWLGPAGWKPARRTDHKGKVMAFVGMGDYRRTNEITFAETSDDTLTNVAFVFADGSEKLAPAAMRWGDFPSI